MKSWTWVVMGFLSSVMLASQLQQIKTFDVTVLCTRRLFYPAENLLLRETVICPADLTLCDRQAVLADGTEVSGCPGPFLMTTRTLPDAYCGQPYMGWLAAVDGTPPYAWSLGSGTLPTGLNFNADGSITGTVPLSAPECQSGSMLVKMGLRIILGD